jgi:glucokinase
MNKAVLGIDVGGTKTLCVLVDEKCETLARRKFKTAPHEGAQNFTRDLQRAARELKLDAKDQGFNIISLGVACAGQVDKKKLKIIASQNLLALENYSIGKYLSQVIDAPITIGNDVQMGLYGEYKMGAAKGAAHALGFFFGTGVGGAAIINSRLFTGASGLGGQIGAVLAQPVGGPKAALSHGIVDRIASKAAIAGEALVMAIKQWAPYLHKKVGTDLSKVTWGMLRRAIEHGDERVEEMLRARMRVVGIALSSIVNFANPEIVVLGGGLVDSMPKLVLKEFESGLREYLAPDVGDALKVKAAALGGDAVALGAAFIALEQNSKSASPVRR